jgi:indole-3-glycerol phosphate synthase
MSILDDILAHKREEVAARRRATPLQHLVRMPGYLRPARSLREALSGSGPAVIAEVKKASPSKGVIRADFNHLQIAAGYVRNGAAALSVLTDERYFQGSLEHLADIRSITDVPLLRKDFIIDSYQVHEARAYGADALLLIAAALPADVLAGLYAEARRIGLEVLVEVHSGVEIEALRGVGVEIFGINNRDLRTFRTSLEVTTRLAPGIPKGALLVSESGIASGRDVAMLRSHGVNAVLVGESLMRAADPGAALAELIREAAA